MEAHGLGNQTDLDLNSTLPLTRWMDNQRSLYVSVSLSATGDTKPSNLVLLTPLRLCWETGRRLRVGTGTPTTPALSTHGV